MLKIKSVCFVKKEDDVAKDPKKEQEGIQLDLCGPTLSLAALNERL